ncbi:MAG: hypothetical protein IKX75_06525 [Desulfovibrio sp.]|nr:hypothetical protein [Desulfovibrio sp.]
MFAMDAQTLVHELRAIEKEIMDLEKRTVALVRRRRELLELLPGRNSLRDAPSRDALRERLREAAGLAPRKK